jgi:protein TonB
MISRDALIWGGAVGLSLTLHLLLFLDSGSRAGDESRRMEKSTRVSFRSVAAPPTAPHDEPQPEPEEKAEPEVVEAPDPPPQPVAMKKRKVAEKVRQEKPPEPQPKPEVKPAPDTTTEVAQKPATPQQANAGSVADPALIEQAKHEYLRRLMAHIESHKKYPRTARRRGIEGEVVVSFRLLAGGTMSELTIEQGHRVLRAAVEEAIAAAQPLPAPPAELKLPMAISFSVMFSLKS